MVDDAANEDIQKADEHLPSAEQNSPDNDLKRTLLENEYWCENLLK